MGSYYGDVYPEFDWNYDADADKWSHNETDEGASEWGLNALRAASGLRAFVGGVVATAGSYVGKVMLQEDKRSNFYTLGKPCRPEEAYEKVETLAEPVKLDTAMDIAANKNILLTELVHFSKYTAFQMYWASAVRAEFVGYWGSRAEQLCATRWLTIKLKEICVRDAHIASAIPMILTLALLPTVDEQAAADFQSSEEFQAAAGTMSWGRRVWRWCLRKKTAKARRTTFIAAK